MGKENISSSEMEVPLISIILITNILTLNPVNSIPTVCTANGKECVFPFKYKGITYNTCTKVESDNGKAWCALKLDSKGDVIIGQWADCDSVCLVETNPRGPGSKCTANGQNCVFPFKYKGKEYNSCTKAESYNGKAWCALELDSQGNVIPRKWAY